MRLESFAVKGLLRFEQECRVDLRDTPPGLIAIVGSNGQGKTTLAETPLAALYRTLPSRAHDLADYASGRDSFVEAEFGCETGSYFARVNIDAVRRTSEAVLVHTDHAGAETSLNDGKVSTFDAAVRLVFPPVETMLASAFSAQNRAGSFSTLDRKGRKALFASLLGLDHYEAMATTARTCAAQVDRERDITLAKREALARDGHPDRLAALEAQLADLAGQRDTMRHELAEADVAIAGAEENLIDAQARVARWQAATAALAQLQTRQRELEAEARTVQQRAERTERDATVERAERARQLAAALADIDARVARNQQVLDQADSIRAAVAALAKTQESIGTQRAELDLAQVAAREIAATIATTERQLLTAQQAARDWERAKEQAATLASVPCGGEGNYGGCRFLALARKAQAQLPALGAAAEPVAGLPAELQALRQRADGLDALARFHRGNVDELESERSRLQPTAKLAEPLAAAEARLSELQQKRVDLEAAAAAADLNEAGRVAAILDDTNDRRCALVTARAENEAELQVQRRVVEADAPARADADGLTRALAEYRTTARDLHARLASLDTTETYLHEALTGWYDANARLMGLHEQIERLNADLLDWQFLTKALARDGLPTLEIAAAGPTVSQYANSLLESCFGPRFSVDLVTQEAKADGKGLKEVFELKVLDNERGGEPRDLTDLSGGEQVIVDEALKNSLTLFVNQRSATPLQVCWRDETTGALDGENAPRYVAMLRKLAEIGGFEHILFVTHNRDAAMAADAQIVVHDGTADVRMPPYPEAA